MDCLSLDTQNELMWAGRDCEEFVFLMLCERTADGADDFWHGGDLMITFFFDPFVSIRALPHVR